MELKDFVSNTLTQIADGVQDAIDKSAGKNYCVSPVAISGDKNECCVHFDLSVTDTMEGKAGITILSGKVAAHSENRITFDVLMDLPSSGGIQRPNRPMPKKESSHTPDK